MTGSIVSLHPPFALCLATEVLSMGDYIALGSYELVYSALDREKTKEIIIDAQQIDSDPDEHSSLQSHQVPSSPFFMKRMVNQGRTVEGGRAAIVRSLNMARARIFASKTVGGRSEPLSLDNYRIGDLHTAYRLPIHRLSNNQLMLLIRRYNSHQDGQLSERKKALLDQNDESLSQLSRPEMINHLQRLMLTRNQGLRETVLEEDTSPSSTQILPSAQDTSTTPKNRALGSSLLADGQTGQHSGTPLSSVEDLPLDNIQEHKTSLKEEESSAPEDIQDKLSETSQALKAKYEQLRVEFLEKLNLLNSLKMKLLAKKKVGTTKEAEESTSVSTPDTTPAQPMTEELTSVRESEANFSTPSASTESTATSQEDNFTTSEQETATTTNLPLHSTGQMKVQRVAWMMVKKAFLMFRRKKLKVREFLEITSAPAELTDLAPSSISTDQPTSESTTTIATTTKTTQEEETTAITTAGPVVPNHLVDNEPTEELPVSTLAPAVSNQDHPGSISGKNMGDSRLIKKLMGILQAKLHHKAIGSTDESQANLGGPPIKFSSTSVKVASVRDAEKPKTVTTGQLVQNHEELDEPTFHTLTVEKLGSGGQEVIQRAEIIHDGESSGVGANSAGGLKVAFKRVGDLSATELADDLKEELETKKANNSGLEERRSESLEGSKEELDPKGLEEFAEANDEETICDAIACDFEQGDLCQWEASKDELQKGDRHYTFLHRRLRRSQMRDNDPQVIRTWHNWEGRYRNRLTGIARAQFFSQSNKRFAAAYVQSNQKATLTAKILSGQQETVRFRAWEATRDVQLRVCCDTDQDCVFETERGVRRGSRRWKEHTATCPKGTQKPSCTLRIVFECVNEGVYQGACGLDNIQLLNQYCPNLIPLVGVHENRRH
uniref:Uncharacterized protein n=1 Tax=Ditylenchus dipsaci TaxID=166011 RepID=A0A915EQG1_9BILA